MVFNLSASGGLYNISHVVKYQTVGFRFEKYGDYGNNYKIIRDKDLTIEFNTIDEIVEFTKRFGEIIIENDSIEIYDNYRE